jgi:hypothetical protein
VDTRDHLDAKTCWANGITWTLTADRVTLRAHIAMKKAGSVCWFEDEVTTVSADRSSSSMTATITDANGALIGTYTNTTKDDNVVSTCAGSDTVTTLPRCPATFDGEECSTGTCDN